MILLSDNERLNFFSNLSTMLHAGIPILEAIDSLNEETKGNLKKVLTQIQADLNQGKSLSQSLSTFPDAFDPISIHLIEASEAGGTLETTLKDLVEATQKQIDLTDKIKSALTYPALVLVVFFGVLLLMLSFVIPRIAAVFTRLSVPLPLPTQVLIFVSNIWLKFTPVVLFVTLAVTVMLVLLLKFKRRQLIRFGSSLPGFSTLAEMNDLANFSRSLSLLLRSGIPITQALGLSQQVISRPKMIKAVIDAENRVNSGRPLAEAFKDHPKVFPVIMTRLAQAGERSGSLDTSMQEANAYFEIQINKNVKQMTVLLEPVMLLVIGLMVGGMMLAIIAPIYGLIGQITPR